MPLLVGAGIVLAAASGSLIAVSWLLYPALLAVLPSRRGASTPPQRGLPRLSVIVAAHNEEAVIDARITNLFESHYPRDLIEVIVASDHSTDSTDAIVSRRAAEGVRLCHPALRGKNHAINEGVLAATGDVLVFTDADTSFDPTALAEVARVFQDPRVGGATFQLVFSNTRDTTVARNGGTYWRFEQWLWKNEDRLCLLAWGTGAGLAVRSDHFKALPAAFADDAVLPLSIVASGARFAYAANAIAREPRVAKPRAELRARARMTSRSLGGTLFSLRTTRALSRPALLAAILCHKLLRWATPFLLAALLLGTVLALPASPLVWVLLGAQLLAAALALVGLAGEFAGASVPLASSFFAFAVANAGIMIGVVRFMRGERKDHFLSVD